MEVQNKLDPWRQTNDYANMIKGSNSKNVPREPNPCTIMTQYNDNTDSYISVGIQSKPPLNTTPATLVPSYLIVTLSSCAHYISDRLS